MISDAELLAAIDAAERQALGTISGEVASDRADAIDRYLGKPYGDEQPGRSSVVSRDVSDVVEGVLANVLKPFVGGDQVVQFDPRGPEDVEAAQQETDYVNFIALERNNGFIVLSSAVKDALLLRAGYVRCDWTTRNDVVTETYQGLSDDELAILTQDKDVEVTQHSGYPGVDGLPLHDIKVRRKQPSEYVEIEPVPPDEILVSNRVRVPSLQDADFVQHRRHVSLSELRQSGYKVADDIGDDSDGETTEQYARQRFNVNGGLWDDETSDPARRLVLYKESYIRIDRDGDGVAELRKICQVGQTILADDEADLIGIACFSSVLMPHQHLGQSVYDLIKDLAHIKTAVQRAYLDSLYLALRPRTAVDANRVNLDDLLTTRPGGVVRTDGTPMDAVMPLVSADVTGPALQGLEYLDAVRENRTGYTRYAQGMESDSLINKTATGLIQAQSQSQMRLEMISRTIAETGVRDLFRIVHAMTLKHSTRAEKVRLRNRWVSVNPREWARRTDLSISVGLGSASPQTQMQNLMILAQAQEKAMPLGMVKPSNAYNLLKKVVTAAGFKSPEEFFTEPSKQPVMGPDGQPVMGPDGKPQMKDVEPPPPKDPMVQAEEVKGQVTMQAKQIDAQTEEKKVRAKFQADMTLQQSNDQRQAALDQQKMALEREKMERELQLKREELAMEFEFKRWEAELKRQTDLESAQITAAADERRANLDAEVRDRDSQRSAENEAKRGDREVETAKIVARSHGKDVDGKLESVMASLAKAITDMVAAQSRPRRIVRDKDGRAEGVVVQ